MQTKLFIYLLLLLTSASFAQDVVKGTISEKDNSGKLTPLMGVNIIWSGTKIGTTSDINGNFSLKKTDESNTLIASMVGYACDSVIVAPGQTEVNISLNVEMHKMNDIVVTGEQKSTYSDFDDIQNRSVMTEKELFKAACCNLSESFETNPSVDVSFSDAITGAKQIEMLGLSGIYTQTTVENLPFMRGLMSNVGLTFMPGTWVNAINVSKGIGSVANGYESITGQIDIDLQKPAAEYQDNFLLNMYGDYDQRFEGNLNYRYKVNDQLSSITLLHASSRLMADDENNDNFSDMPEFKTYNVMQRWNFHSGTGWESQLGFQYLDDKKNGGILEHNDADAHDYKYTTENNQFNLYGKLGYVFSDANYKSFGIQWSYNSYKTNSLYGSRNYTGNEKTGYLNFIYQSNFGGAKEHKFRTGASFLFDQYKETFIANNYFRVEKVPGVFFEYTFVPDETFSANIGLRADQHNYYGTMFTPRIHLRYSPNEAWVFRGVAGKGYRTSNLFTEYPAVFASSREVNINASENFAYGLKQEQAWNYGINLMHYFYYDYREGTISVDLYRTNFDQVTIADLDSSPQEINFSSVNNGAYSNTVQVELNMQPFENFDTRIAYRYMDVKQNINGQMLDRALSSKNRALINLAYSSVKEESDDAQMVYDLTMQWFDKKRIPSTASNPEEFRAKEYSPDFFLVNAQVTRKFSSDLDVYVGVENLLDYRQNDIIIDPMNPHGQYFDASLIWGPTNGRMVYAGFRFKM